MKNLGPKKTKTRGRRFSPAERVQASLYAGWFADQREIEWKSLAVTLPVIAAELEIDISGMKRTQIAMSCMAKLKADGQIVPEGYIPPWDRAYGSLIAKSVTRANRAHKATSGR